MQKGRKRTWVSTLVALTGQEGLTHPALLPGRLRRLSFASVEATDSFRFKDLSLLVMVLIVKCTSSSLTRTDDKRLFSRESDV